MAKLALPRGGANPNRTTRIFVARILPTVTDEAFRAHFEQYGTVQVWHLPVSFEIPVSFDFWWLRSAD